MKCVLGAGPGARQYTQEEWAAGQRWWGRNSPFRKQRKGNQLLIGIKGSNMKGTTGKLLAERVRKLHYHFRMKEHILKDMHTKKKKDKFENFCAAKDRPTLGEALCTTGGEVKGLVGILERNPFNLSKQANQQTER